MLCNCTKSAINNQSMDIPRLCVIQRRGLKLLFILFDICSSNQLNSQVCNSRTICGTPKDTIERHRQ